MIIKQSIYILSIITREMGQLKTQSPACFVMDNWENMPYLTHTLDKLYLTGILWVQCLQISLHTHDNETPLYLWFSYTTLSCGMLHISREWYSEILIQEYTLFFSAKSFYLRWNERTLQEMQLITTGAMLPKELNSARGIDKKLRPWFTVLIQWWG